MTNDNLGDTAEVTMHALIFTTSLHHVQYSLLVRKDQTEYVGLVRMTASDPLSATHKISKYELEDVTPNDCVRES